MPFWVKAKALTLENCPETSPQTQQARRYMQDEEDQLFHELQIHTVITWTRWRCLASKALALVFKKKAWGVIGGFLKQEKALQRTDLRIVLLRTVWSRRGYELDTKLSASAVFRVYYRMTEQSMDHPTQGRRRRHKGPSTVSVAPLLPVPRLADHLDTNDGPSDEEGGKEAKRQKSEPTTPISTSSRPPNEYDEVMGITQVDPGEAARFEEGVDPEFQDVEEELPKEVEAKLDLGTHGSGVSHGGFGRSSLQECLDKLNQARVDAPAPCHSGVEKEDSSNPPQVMSPNVGEEQVHDTLSASRLLPEDDTISNQGREGWNVIRKLVHMKSR